MGGQISFRKECFSFEANMGTKRRGWSCVEVGEDERTIGCQLGGGHREKSVMLWAHKCGCGWMHAFSHAGSYLQDRLPPIYWAVQFASSSYIQDKLPPMCCTVQFTSSSYMQDKYPPMYCAVQFTSSTLHAGQISPHILCSSSLPWVMMVFWTPVGLTE